MYCVKCGVELADSEKVCPLCQTPAYHPQLQQGAGEPLYPDNRDQLPKQRRPLIVQCIITFLFLLPMLICLECDMQFSGTITWSGFAAGGILVGYVILILPIWFVKPNPVIFAPVDFLAIGLYLLYIDLATSGNWFLSFAFPVTGAVALIVTAVVTLLRYVKGGKLFIFGGAFITLGGTFLLTEFLLMLTFDLPKFIGWSVYPLTFFALLGGVLLFLGIYEPARETLERKMFF